MKARATLPLVCVLMFITSAHSMELTDANDRVITIQTIHDALRFALGAAMFEEKNELTRALMELTLKKKVNINRPITIVKNNPTPLQMAKYKKIEIIGFNDHLKHASIEGLRFALATAITDKDNDAIQGLLTIMLKEHIPINRPANMVRHEPFPLHIAIFKEMEELADDLLNKYDAYIDERDGGGQTALLIACRMQNIRMMKFLLDRNAYINTSCNDGFTPLHTIAQYNNPDLIRLLIAHGADVNTANPIDFYNTPLYYTADMIADQNAQELIKNNANIHQKNSLGISPLKITHFLKKNKRPYVQSILDEHNRTHN